jgi:hypothetical protein
MKTRIYMIVLGLVAIAAVGKVSMGIETSKDVSECLAGSEDASSCLLPSGPSTSITAVIAKTHRINATCPPPTRLHNGGDCVLDEDLTLVEPLELESSTKLNCRGHKLEPVAVGIDGPAGTYRPSIPEVAIALIGARDAKILNCVIGSPGRRFDFPVVVMNSKLTAGEPNRFEGTRILHNEMHARATGVTLFAADRNQISDNTITWNGSGIGVLINRSSSFNLVSNNDLQSAGAPVTFVRVVPGSDQSFGLSDIGITTLNSPDRPLYNVIVGDRLLQQTNLGPLQVVGNVLERNSVSIPNPHPSEVGIDCGRTPTELCKNGGGIVVGVMSANTTVRGNTVRGGRPGIRNSGGVANLFNVPGRCTEDPDRYCLSNSDCFISGIDTTSRGSCPALGSITVDARALETVTESNTLIGPFGKSGGTNSLDAAMSVSLTVQAVVQSNRVIAAGSSFGITLQSVALTDATVRNNVVDGAKVGLNLARGTATFFGAQVSQNDFTGSVFGVSTTGPYTFPTELSVGGIGNYWGHNAPPGFRTTDTNNFNVRDSNPFCQQVAGMTAPLPAMCP